MSSTVIQDTREHVVDVTAANYSLTDDIPANRIVLLDDKPHDDHAAARRCAPIGRRWRCRHVRRDRRSALQAPFGYGKRSSWSRCHYGQRIGVIADGAITAGQYVQASDTAGKLGYAKVAALGFSRLAKPKQTTAADGEVCFIRIDKAPQRLIVAHAAERLTKTCWKKFRGMPGQAVAPVHYDLATGQFCMADRDGRLVALDLARATCTSMRLSPFATGYALDQSL